MLLLIATADVGYFMKTIRSGDENFSPDLYEPNHTGRLEISLFTALIGMILAMVLLSRYITRVKEKVSETLGASCSLDILFFIYLTKSKHIACYNWI